MVSSDFVYKPDAWTGAGVVVVNAERDPGAIKSPKLKSIYYICISQDLVYYFRRIRQYII